MMIGGSCSDKEPTRDTKTSQISQPALEPLPEKKDEPSFIQTVKVVKGGTLSSTLRKGKLEYRLIHKIIKATKGSLDLRSLKPGTKIDVAWKDNPGGELHSVRISNSKTSAILIKLDDKTNNWSAERVNYTPREVPAVYSGIVTSNLWESAQEKGLSYNVIMEFAEIFSWVFDFSREVRSGDRWRLVVTELYIDEDLVGIKPIEVAEYQTKNDSYKAIFYKAPGRTVGSYFSPDGRSLRRVFLKSPIKFGRVTSKFSRKRFHPILKRNIPHNGVDYGAPRGTPVHTVGDGRVSFAGRRGDSGIMVKIRHTSKYTTSYLHLNGIRKGIRKGVKVDQGAIIGYVGSTGRATGPHLHFAFYENGKFVDPLGRKFPSMDPVSKDNMEDFIAVAKKSAAKLPGWEQLSWYLPGKGSKKEPSSFK